MEKADEKQVKTWIEYGIREEIQKSGFQNLSEERIKHWIKHEINMERCRIEEEQSKKSLQLFKYIMLAIGTSFIWFIISMIIFSYLTKK